MAVYLNKDLTLNYDREVVLSFGLTIEKQQIAYDLFSKHLPYNYSWVGNEFECMIISYKRSKKKAPPKKIKQHSEYPQINIEIYIKETDYNFFDTDTPIVANELSELKKVNSLFRDVSYGSDDVSIIYYGVKNIKNSLNIVKKLKKLKNLTFKKQKIQFKVRKIDLSVIRDENNTTDL